MIEKSFIGVNQPAAAVGASANTIISRDSIETLQSVPPDSSAHYFSSSDAQNWVRLSFSSTQTIPSQEYQEVGAALEEMATLDAEDDWKIDQAVYSVARYVITELMMNAYPVPRVFSHGPKSVVFNWEHAHNNLYLTVSSNAISALISSTDCIKHRVHYSAGNLWNPVPMLLALRSTQIEQPVVSNARSGTSDIERAG